MNCALGTMICPGNLILAKNGAEVEGTKPGNLSVAAVDRFALMNYIALDLVGDMESCVEFQQRNIMLKPLQDLRSSNFE